MTTYNSLDKKTKGALWLWFIAVMSFPVGGFILATIYFGWNWIAFVVAAILCMTLDGMIDLRKKKS